MIIVIFDSVLSETPNSCAICKSEEKAVEYIKSKLSEDDIDYSDIDFDDSDFVSEVKDLLDENSCDYTLIYIEDAEMLD